MLYKKSTFGQKIVAAIFAAALSFLIVKGIAPWEWERPPSGLKVWESSTVLGRILLFNSEQERLFKVSAVVSLYALIGFGIGYGILNLIGSLCQPYRITSQLLFMSILSGLVFWLS
ncbi:MAG: hypothetical protein ACNYPH_01980 [Gammaproteobacteria bacterium WSBS_2016_MAG_OTU1]